MSVAFRRESDEEHLEPKFELPIPRGPNLVTPAGLALIAERIAALDAQVAATDDAEEEKALRRDLRYWHTRRTTAIPTAPRGDGVVGFGSRVTFTLAGKARTVTLVGDDEADPAADLLPFSAPLARALLGAEAGDLLPFNGREDAIELLAVG
ncbi:nucleoside diphosphate kinase [Sphingomonas sp. Leaf412]|uniref:GreA/GreB family elongation factor n=1 Tax=Sphingomonas sp. Leaf412 TaxID=1736370 RepID=UPI000700C969|nr:GreA/GreB family elongation factor [Sphingomonas sp. Leaf412]KQT31258.1 nucleoside diphosphate kinase [Sphingomonas sp. Leaf412]